MKTNTYILYLRKKIEQGELEIVIEQLRILLKNSPKLNELLLISFRYQEVLKQIRLGVVNFENSDVVKNQICKGILHLVDEIEKLERNPAIQKELEQAISTVNNKNTVDNSTIQALGNVQIGNTINYHTESNLSKRLRLFLFLLVPILVFVGAYLWHKNQVLLLPLDIKVLIENLTPNSELPGQIGVLTLTYGGKSESKNGVSTEAYFENIPSSFKDDTFRLQFEAEGFVLVDTSFNYVESINVLVKRNNKYGLLQGIIYEEGINLLKGIAGVKVVTFWDTSFTDETGKFSIKIPYEHQRKRQRLELFKEGFNSRSLTEPVDGNEILRTYLSRK